MGRGGGAGSTTQPTSNAAAASAQTMSQSLDGDLIPLLRQMPRPGLGGGLRYAQLNYSPRPKSMMAMR
jgi:hypothetical protein